MRNIKTYVLLLLSLFLSFGVSAQRSRMMYEDVTRIGRPFSKDPHVINFRGQYWMYYTIPCNKKNVGVRNMGIACSKDLVNWKKVGEMIPVKEYEKKGICAPCVLVIDGKVHMFYQMTGNGAKDGICHAVSIDGIHFERNKSNPIFNPTGSWTNGRAIDAEVCEFKGKYFLYFATRDKEGKIQKQGVATAPLNTDFSKKNWTQAYNESILYPVYPWEGQCIEAASIVKKDGKLFMFYGGGYNNAPQQIGVAVSTDGIHWKRLSKEPFLRNGKPGEWNSSESGHPHLFTDLDGRTYLFYQGNNDKGKTYYITQHEVIWKDGLPCLK